jgi:hypothetical protein
VSDEPAALQGSVVTGPDHDVLRGVTADPGVKPSTVVQEIVT